MTDDRQTQNHEIQVCRIFYLIILGIIEQLECFHSIFFRKEEMFYIDTSICIFEKLKPVAHLAKQSMRKKSQFLFILFLIYN